MPLLGSTNRYEQQQFIASFTTLMFRKEEDWNVEESQFPEFYFYATQLALAYVVKGNIDNVFGKSQNSLQLHMLSLFKNEIIPQIESFATFEEEKAVLMADIAEGFFKRTCGNTKHIFNRKMIMSEILSQKE